MLAAWKLYPSALTAEQCQQALERLVASTRLEPGLIQAGDELDTSVRRSKVGWPDPREHEDFFSLVEKNVLEANCELWAFDLDGRAEWQFTHYTAEDSGMYHAHLDCALDAGTASCRKLSVTVNLSDPNDYRGGSLKLGAVEQPDPADLRACGSMLVFPSFVEHGVTPLLAGQRYSLVAWFSGPNWR